MNETTQQQQDELVHLMDRISLQPRESIKSLRMRGQEERRKEALETQKQRRRDLTSYARSLAIQSISPSSSSSPQITSATEQMEGIIIDEKKNEQQQQQKQQKGSFINQLMIGEELKDIPNDLETEWILMPIPKNGIRCLVISANGTTSARRMNGSIISKFSSALPNGGSSHSIEKGKAKSSFCILDCILIESTATFYIRDVLCWKSYLLYDCETSFRLFWRDSKLSETNVSKRDINSGNPYSFLPLPIINENLLQKINELIILNQNQNGKVTLIVENKQQQQQQEQQEEEIGSIALYHKQSHYSFGENQTPLLCECLISKLSDVFNHPQSQTPH